MLSLRSGHIAFKGAFAGAFTVALVALSGSLPVPLFGLPMRGLGAAPPRHLYLGR